MKQRVFQIDQECFIIFAEELSSKKERFLRIGNSDFLKSFGESLTFITLVTPLYLGDTFKELDIFRPAVDRKIIGLKKVVDNFIDFLKSGSVNMDNLTIIYAEEEKINNDSKKKTEEQFIKYIKSNKNLIKHSFASFYSDGNIRIFNKSELMFDLKTRLSHVKDERQEIQDLSSYFSDFYANSYKKTGLIHSGKSVFFFSKERYACVSDGGHWVKEAIRVGINPEKIEVLYLTENITPNSLWVKAFLNTSKSNGKIKLALREKDPFWLHLVPKDTIIPIFPDKDTIKVEIGDIKLFFQNKRINVLFNKIKLTLYGEKGFLDAGQMITGEYLQNNQKTNVEFMLDTFKKGSYTLYSYHPVIIRDVLNGDYNYCKEFWDKVHVKNKNYIAGLINQESDNYSVDDMAKFENKDEFVYKLFLETVRRSMGESDFNDELFEKKYNFFADNLKNFTGKLIYNNKIIIEQVLGQDSNSRNLIIRDILAKDNLIDIRDEHNPFLFFQKDEDLDGIKESYRKYKEIYLSKSNKGAINDILKKYNFRFSSIISQKKLFLEEREKLKKFIEEIETKEKIMEEREKKSSTKNIQETNNTSANKISNKIANIENNTKTNIKDNKDSNKDDKVKKTISKNFVLIFVTAIIGAILLTSAGFIFVPKIAAVLGVHKKSETNQISQKKYLDKIHEKYSNTDNGSAKESVYYKFHMTVLDNLMLTNEIAVRNGYHKIVIPAYKKYMKGHDPDWIYPGRRLKMPDGTTIVVKNGDNLWKICENYLIYQINKDEIKIRDLIVKSKKKEFNIGEVKKEFLKIKKESYSEMIRNVISVLINQKNYDEWEPYLSKYKK